MKALVLVFLLSMTACTSAHKAPPSLGGSDMVVAPRTLVITLPPPPPPPSMSSPVYSIPSISSATPVYPEPVYLPPGAPRDEDCESG